MVKKVWLLCSVLGLLLSASYVNYALAEEDNTQTMQVPEDTQVAPDNNFTNDESSANLDEGSNANGDTIATPDNAPSDDDY